VLRVQGITNAERRTSNAEPLASCSGSRVGCKELG